MLRPSSAPVAKASTVCSSKLDTTYMSMNRVPTPLTHQTAGSKRRNMTNGFVPRPEGHGVKTLFLTPGRTQDQRCSRPLCSSQHTVGTPPSPATPVQQEVRETRPAHPTGHTRPIPQDPTACTPPYWTTMTRSRLPERSRTENTTGLPEANHQCSTLEHPPRNRCPGSGSGSTPERTLQKLLRKEVIQPHLPVRLPCYDLVLITDPTFDGSLHKGWATGFGCYRLS